MHGMKVLSPLHDKTEPWGMRKAEIFSLTCSGDISLSEMPEQVRSDCYPHVKGDELFGWLIDPTLLATEIFVIHLTVDSARMTTSILHLVEGKQSR